MEGKARFIHGNPTPECRQFLDHPNAGKWVTEPIRIRYSGLKKF
jgi:hypothetical protein